MKRGSNGGRTECVRGKHRRRAGLLAEALEPRTLLSGIIYVDALDNNGTAANDGAAWASAYTSLADALTASRAGDEIRVGKGTYRPTSGSDQTISFWLKAGVAVYGGYAGYNAADPDARDIAACPTILSGGGWSYHVVMASGVNDQTVLDGVTITQGNARGSGGYAHGGGLYLDSGSNPTIRNCTFKDNSADDGGAVYGNSPGAVTMIDCTFINNRASYDGGAIKATGGSFTLTDCTFTGNSASSDGGVIYSTLSSTMTLTNCTLSGNHATYDGGGIYNASSIVLAGCTLSGNSGDYGGGIYSRSSLAASNCIFTGNSAWYDGGGVYAVGSAGLTDCIFAGNSVWYDGGGVYAGSGTALTRCTFTRNKARYGSGVYNKSSTALSGCAFLGNSATSGGGGVYNDRISAELVNCAFIGNSGGLFGGSAVDHYDASSTLINCTFSGHDSNAIYTQRWYQATLINCIAWGNGTSPVYGETPLIRHSLIEGGFAGTGNLDADPLFVRTPSSGDDGKWGTADDDYGDLRLNIFSPAIDAGDSTHSLLINTTDAAGDLRFRDVPTTADTGLGTAPIVDLGAYETVPVMAVDAGGPYAVAAGSALTLASRGASDSTEPLTFAWDFDGDGQYDDATGPTPAFFPANGPGTFTVALRISDALGRNMVDMATIQVMPANRYVDAAATGAGTGLSWTDAYASLQAALQAAVPGVAIRVAQGTYKPTASADRTISFVLKNGISILGGYAGAVGTDPNARDITAYPSILSGEIGAASYTDNSYHVVTGSNADSSALLDGLTITGGYANGSSSNSYGGGLYLSSASPTIRNCTFTGNWASSGGGLYNTGSSPALSNCTFSTNGASYGGAVFNNCSAATFANCAFTGNSANEGGGMYNSSSSPSLDNCAFTANSSSSGGGMYNSGSSPTLTNCTFTGGGSVGTYGGGMYNTSGSTPRLVNCAFRRNSASWSGGAIYNQSSSPTLVNCTFVGNSASQGSAIYDWGFSSTSLANCTFSANRGGAQGRTIYTSIGAPTLVNCIIWGEGTSAIYGSGVTVRYSLVEGGFTGTGNINADPMFIRNPGPGGDGIWNTADDDYGDLRLRPLSAAVDAGDKTVAALSGITTDIAGQARFIDVASIADTGLGGAPMVDMGAYEAVPALDVKAGGPYSVLAGYKTTLSARGATDQPGALSYAWDFDGDGEYDDATGPAPIFWATGLQAGATFTVALQLTDASGSSAFDTATIQILQSDRYVDPAATGAGNGMTWAIAYTSLATALAAAAPGINLIVAQGVYKPTTSTSRTVSFALKNGVAIYGGYAGVTAADPNVRDLLAFRTILSGDLGTARSYHVVTAASVDSSAILDGVTITAGQANGTSTNASGGGIYLTSASPTIRNCTFTANSATNGGALGAASSSSPTVVNCIFTGNSANIGAAVYSSLSTTRLTNCTIVGNTATSASGGIHVASSTLTAANCIVWGNSPAKQINGAATVRYSLVQGGSSGTGNTSADPLFVDPDGPDNAYGTPDDDLRLQQLSPAIDAGNNAETGLAGITTDAAGSIRFHDVPTAPNTGVGAAPIVDMGAFESTSTVTSVTVAGTDGPDVLCLRLSPDQKLLQIWRAATPTGTPVHAVVAAAVTSCTFALMSGADALYVDWAYGNPLPAGWSFASDDAGRIILINAPGPVALGSDPFDLADDELVIQVAPEQRQAMLQHLRSMLASRSLFSGRADEAHGLRIALDADGNPCVTLALLGDMTGDGTLDGDDYFAMDQAFLAQDAEDPAGDWTSDGQVTAADYLVLDRVFLQLSPSRAPAAGPQAAPLAAFEPDWLPDVRQVLA